MSAPVQDFTLGRAGLVLPTYFRDDFDTAADPSWTDVGITTVGGSPNDATRYLTVSSGRLTLGVTGAGYKVKRVPGLKRVEVGFRLSTGTSNDNTALAVVTSGVALSSDKANLTTATGVGLNSVHAVVAPGGRTLSYYNGSLVSSPAADTDTFTLSASTDYVFSMTYNANGTIDVVDPDGGSETLAASAGTARWGDTVYVEVLVADTGHKIPQINYVSLTGEDGVVLRCSGWEQEGDSARVKITLRDSASVADVKAARDQLQGYGPHNTDEPVVPVTWAKDSSRDGFYEVQSISSSSDLTGRMGSSSASGSNIPYVFDAELLRVPGWKAPLFEVVSAGNDRGGGGVATGEAWIAIPGSAVAPAVSGTFPTLGAVTVDDGTVDIYTADQFYDGSLAYYVDASDFYEGAPTIEATADSGATWRTVVGRQFPGAATAWRITNHRIRISLASGVLRAEYFDDTRWEATDFHVTYAAGASTVTSWAAVTILENSLTCVGVRLTSTAGLDAQYVDLRIRRGAIVAEGVLVGSSTLGLFRAASETGALTTGGIRADAANDAGNQYVIYSPDTTTKDITGTSGVHLTSTGTAFHFGFSPSFADLGATVNSPQSYFAAMDHHQKIVAR